MKRFIFFSISGSVSLFTDVSLLYILTDIFNVWYLLSATISFLIASIVHFTILRLWVFEHNKVNHWKQFSYFFSIHTANLILGLTLLYLLVEYAGAWYILAKILTVSVTVFSNFFLQRRFTFNPQTPI